MVYDRTTMDARLGTQVSAVAFDTDGLTMGVGTSSAHCLTFDLRSSRPTFVKEHQYGLPVTGIKFHQVIYSTHGVTVTVPAGACSAVVSAPCSVFCAHALVREANGGSGGAPGPTTCFVGDPRICFVGGTCRLALRNTTQTDRLLMRV